MSYSRTLKHLQSSSPKAADTNSTPTPPYQLTPRPISSRKNSDGSHDYGLHFVDGRRTFLASELNNNTKDSEALQHRNLTGRK